MKKILILVCFIFILGLTAFIFYYSKTDYQLTGEEYVFIDLNSAYEELGAKAKHCTVFSALRK